jgi:hypothetical protein
LFLFHSYLFSNFDEFRFSNWELGLRGLLIASHRGSGGVAVRPSGRGQVGFFTGGNRAVYRGYRCYRWGTITVPSGSNRSHNSNLNLNSKKMKKSIKITKK